MDRQRVGAAAIMALLCVTTLAGPIHPVAGSHPTPGMPPAVPPEGKLKAVWLYYDGPQPAGSVIDEVTVPITVNGSGGLIVIMYSYPDFGGDPDGDGVPNSDEEGWWFRQLVDALRDYPNISKLVVVNPESGPGGQRDENYVRAIRWLHGAGAVVLGYVPTGYSAYNPDNPGRPGRTLSEVEGDVDRWLDFYPEIDGLFVDEVPWRVTGDRGRRAMRYYASLTEYAHGRGLYPVVGNPGTAQENDAYFANDVFDIIVVYEDAGYPSPSDVAVHGDRRRRAVLVHSVGANEAEIRRHVAELSEVAYYFWVWRDDTWGSGTTAWNDSGFADFARYIAGALAAREGGGGRRPPETPPEILVDETYVSDRRCDVGTTQTVGFHVAWANNQSDAAGCRVYVNGTVYVANETGWVALSVTSGDVRRARWTISSIVCGGRRVAFKQVGEDPEIIWDRVRVELKSSLARVQVGREANITYEAYYEYDGSPFTGTVTLRREPPGDQVGEARVTVESIADPRYGLTSFQSNEIALTFDRVRAEPSVGALFPLQVPVTVELRYESDSAPVEGAEVRLGGEPLRETAPGTYSTTVFTVSPTLNSNVTVEAPGFEKVTVSVSSALPGNVALYAAALLPAAVAASRLSRRSRLGGGRAGGARGLGRTRRGRPP